MRSYSIACGMRFAYYVRYKFSCQLVSTNLEVDSTMYILKYFLQFRWKLRTFLLLLNHVKDFDYREVLSVSVVSAHVAASVLSLRAHVNLKVLQVLHLLLPAGVFL